MAIFKRPNSSSPFRFNNENDDRDIETLKIIFDESVNLFGSDIYYIRQELSGVEPIFGEYLTKVLQRAIPLRAFVEEQQAWGGVGDIYSKFGLTNSEDMTLHMSKIAFAELGFDPKVSDIIYHVTSKKLFEIQTPIDDGETSFMPLGKHVAFILKCRSYQYDHSEVSQEVIDEAEFDSHISSILSTINNAPTKDITNTNNDVTAAKDSIIDDTETDPLG